MYGLSRNAGERNECTRTSRVNLASITSRGDRFQGGTVTCQWSSAATRSWSRKEPARFPPRPSGKVSPTRSISRPERHFADSFVTIRLAIARALVTWLPRCPLCHNWHERRGCHADVFATPHVPHPSECFRQ